MEITQQTEVLLLGTFHFRETNDIDFSSSKIQQQIQNMVEKISKFNPDKILIEAPINFQEDVSEIYNSVPNDYFQNFERMRMTTLGSIDIYGDVCPITYNDEIVQVAFRLAKMLGKNKVYPIDYVKFLDLQLLYDRAGNDIEGWDNLRHIYEMEFNRDIEKIKSTGTITDLYKYYNGNWYEENHSKFYLLPNIIGAGEDYAGSKVLLDWYERNIKIFANIQKASMGCKRIFVLYGAGHLSILNTLINQYEGLKLLNVFDYL